MHYLTKPKSETGTIFQLYFRKLWVLSERNSKKLIKMSRQKKNFIGIILKSIRLQLSILFFCLNLLV